MGLLSLVGRPHDDDHDDRGGLHRDLRVNDWNDFSHYRVSGEGGRKPPGHTLATARMVRMS